MDTMMRSGKKVDYCRSPRDLEKKWIRFFPSSSPLLLFPLLLLSSRPHSALNSNTPFMCQFESHTSAMVARYQMGQLDEHQRKSKEFFSNHPEKLFEVNDRAFILSKRKVGLFGFVIDVATNLFQYIDKSSLEITIYQIRYIEWYRKF